jgi:O-antigen/teichoic acid export membrane protein
VGLGAFQVAEREIAYETGRGNLGQARVIENSASLAALTLSAVLFVAGAVVAADGFSKGHSIAGVVALAVAATLVTQQFAIRATVILRTGLRFRALGWSVAGTSVAITGATLGGAYLAGTSGALVGAVVGSLMQATILSLVARPPRLRAAETPVLARIYRLAPSFLLLGLGTAVLGTVDQLAVASLLGPTALGLYSAAYLGNGFALRIPTMINAAIYPRMQQELGRTADVGGVYRLAERTSVVVAILVPIAIAAFAFMVPLGIQLFLPEFGTAVTASRLLLVGILGLAVSMPAAQFLITTNRQWTVVAFTGVAVTAMAGFYLFVAAIGRLGITGVAVVDAAGYLAFAALIHAAASRAAGQSFVRAAALVMTQASLAVVIVCAGLLGDGLFGASTAEHLLAAGGGLAASLVACGALAFVLIRLHPDARADLAVLILAVAGWTKRRRTPH